MSEMIPAGRYPGVAVTVVLEDGASALAQFAHTKDNKAQVCIHFEILEGEWQGTRLPWIGYFSQAAAARTIQSLRYAGWKGTDFYAIKPGDLPNQVDVTVEHDEYEGKVRARIAWVNLPGGGGLILQRPMSEQDLRRFSATWRDYVRKHPPVEGKPAKRNGEDAGPASSPPPPSAPPPTYAPGDEYETPPPYAKDDEIPF